MTYPRPPLIPSPLFAATKSIADLASSHFPLSSSSSSFVNWDEGGEWGGLIILLSMVYYPGPPHSDQFPHTLIRTTSGNCVTSSMHPLGLILSVSGCVNPPRHHSSDNDGFFSYTLIPPPPYLSHSIISLPNLSPVCSFYISLSSNYCITSPISLLVDFHSLLLISPITLSPRRSSLSTPLLSICSTPICLVFLHFTSLCFNRIFSSPSDMYAPFFPLCLLSSHILFLHPCSYLITPLYTTCLDQIGLARFSLA